MSHVTHRQCRSCSWAPATGCSTDGACNPAHHAEISRVSELLESLPPLHGTLSQLAHVLLDCAASVATTAEEVQACCAGPSPHRAAVRRVAPQDMNAAEILLVMTQPWHCVSR